MPKDLPTPADDVQVDVVDVAKEVVLDPAVLLKPDVVVDPGVVLKPDVVVDPGVVLKPDVVVDPGVLLKPDVVLDPDVVLKPDVVVDPDVLLKPDVVLDPDVVLKPDVGVGDLVAEGVVDVHESVREFGFAPPPDFVPFTRISVPTLRVVHARASDRPDGVFAPGERVRVVVDNGHFTDSPMLTVTGPAGRVDVGQPAGRPAQFEFDLRPDAAAGPYVVTANVALGSTPLPMEVPVLATTSFGVVTVGVPVVQLTRPILGAVPDPGGSAPVRLEVLASSLTEGVRLADVQIDPASLTVRTATPGVDPRSIGITAARGAVAGPLVDATATYPANLAEAVITVHGVLTVNGMRHEFIALPSLTLARISVGNIARRTAEQFLDQLALTLPLEPDLAVRQYLPGVPVVPVLVGGLPGAQPTVPGVPNAITSATHTLPLPGAASPADVVTIDLGVEWQVGGTTYQLVRSPLDTTGGAEVSLTDLSVGIVPVPSDASWFNPLAGPPPATLPRLELGVRISATISSPAFGLPATTVGPVTRTWPNPLPVGLPVPELVALYRAPDMGSDWAGAPTNSYGDGAVAILPRFSSLPVAPDRALVALNEPDLLPPSVRALATFVPDDGLSRLGMLGQVLQLLVQPQRLPIPGGGGVPIGLAALRALPAPAGSAAHAALAPLLALLTGIEVFAASIARLVALTAAKDPGRPDTYIRILPPAGRLSMPDVATPFIRHSDVFHGTDVNVEDETESLILLGGPASSVTLYCDPRQRTDHGAATFETNGGYCCLEARLSQVGSGYQGSGTYPQRPLGPPAPDRAPDGVTFGRVRATARVNPTAGIRLGGPGGAFDQTLARSVSSLAFGAPLP